jgi:VanZ family protein
VTPRRRWLLVVLVAGVILVASLVPTGGGTTPTLLGVGLDKWQHLGGYAALAVVLGYALRAGDRPRTETLVVAFAVTVGYGILIECLQLPLASRAFSVGDMLANGVGAAVGTVVVSRFGR